MDCVWVVGIFDGFGLMIGIEGIDEVVDYFLYGVVGDGVEFGVFFWSQLVFEGGEL